MRPYIFCNIFKGLLDTSKKRCDCVFYCRKPVKGMIVNKNDKNNHLTLILHQKAKKDKKDL